MRTSVLRLLIAAIAAVVVALSAAACGSSGGGTSSVALVGPLANAADATSRAGGAHMSILARIEAPSLPSVVTMSAGGFFNYSSHEGKLAVTLTGLPASAATGSATSIEEIFSRTDVYVDSALFAGKLPGGARWVKIDLARLGDAAGINPSQLLGGQSNPAQFLEYLKASGGSVQTVGQEPVRGVPTTHYRGTIDLKKVAGVFAKGNSSQREAIEKGIAKLGTSTLPVEVWADSHKLVRRIELSLKAPAGGQQLGMRMTIEFFGFGATPAVTVPAAGETFDATSTALSGLSAVGG